MNHLRTLRAPLACVMALCGAAALVSTTALVGCSSQPNGAAKNNGEGQVQVVVAPLSQANVSAVTVTVSGGPAGSGTSTITLTKQANGTWTGLVSGIAVGSGYTFSMSATDSSGNPIYTGAASSVSVTQNQTVEVVINGQQTSGATVLAVTPPVIDSILISLTNVAPGGSVALAATAHDANPSDTLTYSWMATAGTFSAANSNVTNWTAPATAGTYPITLTVTDTTNNTSVTAQANVVVATNNGTGAADVTVTLNTWPVVNTITGTPNYVVKSVQTQLTALATDADNDPITYAWTSSCAGTFTNAQVPTPGFTLSSSATDTACTFTVNVADNRGGTGTGTLTLPVGQPTAAIAPTIGKTVQSLQLVGPTDTVSLTVNATDPQGQPLTFSWSTSGGTLGTPNTSANSSQVVWTPPASATASWLVTAQVSDSSGAAATKSFTIKPTSCFGVAAAPSTAWAYGVMADTQWISTDDGSNPNSCAVAIINNLNTQFIAQGVKFVVHVGDLQDNGSSAGLDDRAEFTQALYNAGIGLFPLRGNHEASAPNATEFKRVFPQTAGGLQNATPSDVFAPNPDDVNTHPVAVSGAPFAMGLNFSKPSSVLTGNTTWDGLSYSFDYNNARFVLLDQFMMPNGTSANGNLEIPPQQPWINTVLAGKPAGGHTFVFAHKGLITQDHVDTLFGNDPSQDPTDQDAFITSLQTNGVHYYMGGHDHMHNRAIVTTTDGKTASVQNIICSSDSSKFYTPNVPSNDVTYDVPAFGHTRETPISQELWTAGYYIVTIDGVKATVDFYSAEMDPSYVDANDQVVTTTPPMNFTKRETYGYGLNGKEFVVPQGQSYATVQDSFAATTAKILGGTNAKTNTAFDGRNLSTTVDTGWNAATCATLSDILSLWMTVSTLGSAQTDTYVLSLNFTNVGLTPGSFGLATKDANGNWINAVDKDFGSAAKTFVQRAWQAGDALGTWGVDPVNNIAWAVVNYSNSDFAVATFNK